MTQAFVTAGKQRQYWTINVADEYCAIHSGTVGTPGEWQLLENLDVESAIDSANDLIAAKKQAGYVLDPTFDPLAQWYFDVGEFGPHPLTTHPSFLAHFTDELYLDIAEEESPFGSDDGAEALVRLTTALQEDQPVDLSTFAEVIVVQKWEMPFHPPGESTDVDYWSVGGPATTDKVIAALAFGSIKITGKVAPGLKALARQSLLRLLDNTDQPASVSRMLTDLESFAT
ncbi:WGR domain-containing protein [Nakamurella antarctica]|uniref:WGR domain-containing protein n=1 Tax=Nakamurella antarctica TaxID=1902245 RepID=UPI0013DE76BB|nr:WGR domain-containing protein [Nakamurella antarctica]